MSEILLKWPDWLKPVLVDSYSVEPQDRRIKTEMEVGSVFRAEFNTDETVVTCSAVMNGLQAKWFETFERDVLIQGSKWFKMKLFTAGEYGIEHTVRFRERPKLSAKEGEYSTYTFSLDVSRREGLMDAGLAEVLSIYDPDDVIAATDLLQIVMNERWPLALPYAA